MLIFPGSRSISLGQAVAQATGFEIGKLEYKHFPDGELYLRLLSNVDGRETVVIQSTRNSDDLIELFLLLDALQEYKASKVIALVPYLAYARQDKVFLEGEALSAKTILKLIHELADGIITVNCHFLDQAGDAIYHGMEVKNIDAFPLLAEYFRDILHDPILIAPDKGSLRYAEQAAEYMNCKFNHLSKLRLSGEEVSFEEKNLGVEGKDVLILDDMISTGGTILKAAKLIREQGANSINVGCVHGVFSKNKEEIASAVDQLVCTDTLPTEFSKVSVAQLLAKILGEYKRI